MFECFARSRIYLSVSPSTHREQLTCVDVVFYFKFDFGWEGRGYVSGSLFVLGVGGSVVLKLSFRGVGWCYFEFLGDYFLLREVFVFSFFIFSVLWWNFINIGFTFTHTIFFVYLGEM